MEIPQVGEGGRSKVTSASPTDDGECANMCFGAICDYLLPCSGYIGVIYKSSLVSLLALGNLSKTF